MGKNRTSMGMIVQYWERHVDETMLNIDWSEAEEFCWRCGSPKELMRCHIVPRALGGRDEPSNYVILCHSCHAEGPNVADPAVMWDWLKAYKSSLYETFFIDEGLREYRFIYGRSFLDDLSYLFPHEATLDNEWVFEIMKQSVMRSTTHFGQYLPNKATVAGQLRMTIKTLAQTMGKELPDMERKMERASRTR